ncbi:MAG: peptidase S16 [Alphaproteobacteria bacterium]|nr:peptidase S16 [Alphaproteobacteria bacterium]
MSPFDPSFETLPRVIPIFPLTGVLLLPRGRLPLNIFEPRYLAMTRDALAGPERIIGMIQPTERRPGEMNPPVYETGCAGRLISFSETEDGRYLITLAGVARFRIVEELPLQDSYRRVVADFHRFRGDLDAPGPAEGAVDRPRLLDALRLYLDRHGIKADWDVVKDTPDDRLVTSLAMMCPFNDSEKQALLEAPDLYERARVIVALLEMASLDQSDGERARH